MAEYLSYKIHLNRANLSLLDFVPPFHKMLTNIQDSRSCEGHMNLHNIHE